MQLKESFFNKDLILLWQGHFVSATGTVIYSIVLGFWVLKVTGSTALMGIVSASVVLPKLFVGPVAGVIVDESNKKWILVLMDTISGSVICLIAFLAFKGLLSFWHAVVAGIVIGSAEAFFKPAVQSIIPEIVSKKMLSRANSAYSTAFSASNLIGRFLAGILYNVLGVPLLFLLNGVSYLFSAFTELFLSSFSAVESKKMVVGTRSIGLSSEEPHEGLFTKITLGAKQVIQVKGLLEIFVIISFLNFFGFAVVTLYVPFFAQNTSLGILNYGFVMGISTGGALLGQFIFSRISIKPSQRHFFFCIAGVVSNLFIVIFPFTQVVPILMALIFLAGITSAPINIALVTALQIAIPQKFTGRIFSLVGMVGGLLVPLAMVVSGAVAEIFQAKILISLCALVLSILFSVTFTSSKVKMFLNCEGSE